MERKTKKIIAISISPERGTVKKSVDHAVLQAEHGICGDAHAGAWHRQVSLLACERIDEAAAAGAEVEFGGYGENIATIGVDWKSIPIGTRVSLGEEAELEITQIGKKCHSHCEIYHLTGDCIMPREGVFARVVSGGRIQPGDTVVIL